MRIALINPPITSKERYGADIGDIGGHQAPLGLCCLAAFLEKNGFEVTIIDAEARRLENSKVFGMIDDFKPDAIGVTSTTVAFYRACGLARDIKSRHPAIPIIIGGPHISANPYQALSYECFNYGVMGEGEITLVELLGALKRNDPVENIKGIVYRKEKEVVCSDRRPPIEDLNDLPFPARHLLKDIFKYRPPMGSYLKTPILTMITSRGCPYECIFCDNNVFGRNIRYYSPEYVVSEMENLIDLYAAKEIAFLDDTFTVNEERLRKILHLIRRRGIKIKWSCMTRADRVTKDTLKEMKDAGCWMISIGIESGNQAVLDFIKKGITLEQVRNAVNWCDETGIYVKGFFMIGHIGDSLETIDETISFSKSIPLTDIVVTIATPIPGTEFHDLAPKYGTLQNRNWSSFSYWEPVFIPKGLTEKTLYLKQRQFYREFYLSHNVILKQWKKILNMSYSFGYFANIIRAAVTLHKRRR